MRAQVIFLVALAGFFPGSAHAGMLFDPALFFQSTTVDVNGSASSQNNFYGDFRLHYVIADRFLAGVGYSLISGSGDNGYALTQSAIGPSVGWTNHSWIVTFTYFLLSNREDRNGGNSFKYTEGKGYQFDCGYMIPLSDAVSMGPTVSYRSLSYEQREVNGTGASPWTYTQTDFFPYLGFLFLF